MKKDQREKVRAFLYELLEELEKEPPAVEIMKEGFKYPGKIPIWGFRASTNVTLKGNETAYVKCGHCGDMMKVDPAYIGDDGGIRTFWSFFSNIEVAEGFLYGVIHAHDCCDKSGLTLEILE